MPRESERLFLFYELRRSYVEPPSLSKEFQNYLRSLPPT